MIQPCLSFTYQYFARFVFYFAFFTSISTGVRTTESSVTIKNSSSIPRLNFTRTLESSKRTKRAATARPERVWDYAVIPYEIDANFSGVHKALFKQVCID